MTDDNLNNGRDAIPPVISQLNPTQPVRPMYYGQYPFADTGMMGYTGDMVSLTDILQVLWRKKATLLVMVLLSSLVAVLYLVSAIPVYKAEALLELNLRRPRIMPQQEAVINDTRTLQSSEMYNTQIVKMKSSALQKIIASKVADKIGMAGKPEEDVVEWLSRNVKVEPIRRSSLVKVSVMSPDPGVAAFVANTFTLEAVEISSSINKKTSEGAVVWLQSQIGVQGKALKDAELKILEFLKLNPIETLEAQRETVKKAVMKYSEDLTKAVAVRDELLAKYTDQHPEVIAQRQVISAAETQYKAQLQKSEALESRMASSKTSLAELEREKKALELSYNGILQRVEEARLSADENTATIEIVEKADVPSKPVHPRKMLVLALSIMAGLFAGFTLALINYRLEDRIWGPSDVEQDINIKLIGLIPASASEKREDLATIGIRDKFSLVSEAFNNVRGSLDMLTASKIFLVTSTMPEEGKTITSCNIAVASAKVGRKTLLVEMDMRRPRLAHIWKISDPEWSLIHALCDEQEPDFSRLPRKSGVDNLDVIVSHVVNDVNPAEVLGTRRVRDFFKWAAENYERVIIDSPPVGVTSDSIIISRYVDGVIIVGRFNKTKKSQCRTTIKHLLNSGAYVTGMVVNDVDFKKGDFANSGMSYGYYTSKAK